MIDEGAQQTQEHDARQPLYVSAVEGRTLRYCQHMIQCGRHSGHQAHREAGGTSRLCLRQTNIVSDRAHDFLTVRLAESRQGWNDKDSYAGGNWFWSLPQVFQVRASGGYGQPLVSSLFPRRQALGMGCQECYDAPSRRRPCQRTISAAVLHRV